MNWSRILDIFRSRRQPPSAPIGLDEVRTMLLSTYPPSPERLNGTDLHGGIDDRLHPELLERRLEVIRFALSHQGNLTDLTGHFEVSDGELRQSLMTMEVRLTSLATGAPPRRLPWELASPFRSGHATSEEPRRGLAVPTASVGGKRRPEGKRVVRKSAVHDMFGLPPPRTPEKIELNEVKCELAYYTYDFYTNRLNLEDVRRAIAFFRHRPDLYEYRLQIIRCALSYEGDLTDVMSRFELSDRELRQFLMSVETRLSSLLNDEPVRRLPWELEPPFLVDDIA